MESRHIRSSRAFGLLLFVCLAANMSVAEAGDEHRFSALGAEWRAYDITWTEIENHWLIGATVDVARAGNRNLTGAQILAGLCKEIVRERPGVPVEGAHAGSLFRVDLNVVAPNGRTVWPYPVPVPVRSGECQISDGRQDFFITYPGGLDGWRFLGGTIQQAGNAQRRQLTFEPDEGSEVTLGDFDFELACTATLNDPTVQTVQSSYERQNAGSTFEPGVVVIVAKQGGGSGVFVGEVYQTSSGKCVRQQ